VAPVETSELNAHFIHQRGFVMRTLSDHTDTLIRTARRDLRCAASRGGGQPSARQRDGYEDGQLVREMISRVGALDLWCRGRTDGTALNGRTNNCLAASLDCLTDRLHLLLSNGLPMRDSQADECTLLLPDSTDLESRDVQRTDRSYTVAARPGRRSPVASATVVGCSRFDSHSMTCQCFLLLEAEPEHTAHNLSETYRAVCAALGEGRCGVNACKRWLSCKCQRVLTC
jgi:hypothetical protein